MRLVMVSLVLMLTLLTTGSAQSEGGSSWWGNAEGDTRPIAFHEEVASSLPMFYTVIEPAYNYSTPQLGFMYQGTNNRNESIYTIGIGYGIGPDSYAQVPDTYGALSPEFSCYQCEQHWAWTLKMVDSLGITRASICRDCNERFYAVADGTEVDLPESVQVIVRLREPQSTIE